MPAQVLGIATDRRTDAEILSEIAAADVPLILLGRNDPTPLAERLDPIPSARSLILMEPTAPEGDLSLTVTRTWPARLALLVTDPRCYSLIALTHGTSPAGHESANLWSWLVQQALTGTVVTRCTSAEAATTLPLGTPSRRRLVPHAAPPLPTVPQHQILRLADAELPTATAEATALRAGLLQWHDALDASHECSQSIEGRGRNRAGDYWHAIMHRREPDYGNSKYWFRRVGSHPIFPELGRRAEPLIASAAPDWQNRLLRAGWDPFAFVDFCEAAASAGHSAWESAAEAIQEIEMLLLLESTYREALTPG